jgi:hypothetical protein
LRCNAVVGVAVASKLAAYNNPMEEKVHGRKRAAGCCADEGSNNVRGMERVKGIEPSS